MITSVHGRPQGRARGGGSCPPPWPAKASQKQYVFRLFWEKQYLFRCFLSKNQVLAPLWKIFALPWKKVCGRPCKCNLNLDPLICSRQCADIGVCRLFSGKGKHFQGGGGGKTNLKNLYFPKTIKKIFLDKLQKHTIDQGSQTRGPRAACGPPEAFVRPANISKMTKL